MIGGVDWHLPNLKVTFWRSAFFLVGLMLQFFLSWAAQTNKSWFDCPENILSVRLVHYTQWEQRNQNSRSELFYIKNCLSFVLPVLTPMSPPLSVITMKFRIKQCLKKIAITPESKDRLFVNYTASGCWSTGNILDFDQWLQGPLAPHWVKKRI